MRFLQREFFRCTATISSSARSKVVKSVEAAIDDIKPNLTILSGGFGLSGVPDTLINAILKKPEINNLTAVSNNAGLEGRGLSQLLSLGQITKMVSLYIGGNRAFEKMYLTGGVNVELVPQGTLAERIRAGAAGVPAFYTPTGVGTWVEEGKIPVRYSSDGTEVEVTSEPREARDFNGRKYILERAIDGDVALVKAYKADTSGNCWFRGAARNFNLVMGRNARLTIVEAEHIVETGEIPPEDVHLPSVYVDRIVQSTTPKDIEIFKFANSGNDATSVDDVRLRIIKRAALEFKNGTVANLGIGMPTLAPDLISPEITVTLQSENGILGMGPYPKEGEEDPDMINAGKETVTLAPGASLFGSEESFAMIRSGKVKLAVLGAMQVSAAGDLANWGLPGRVKGMGGAMDLVLNPAETKVLVVMEHTDKKGRAKIVQTCQFPLTGKRCVSRIITELGVFDVVDGKLVLTEIASDTDLETIKAKTDAEFTVSDNLQSMKQ